MIRKVVCLLASALLPPRGGEGGDRWNGTSRNAAAAPFELFAAKPGGDAPTLAAAVFEQAIEAALGK